MISKPRHNPSRSPQSNDLNSTCCTLAAIALVWSDRIYVGRSSFRRIAICQLSDRRLAEVTGGVIASFLVTKATGTKLALFQQKPR